MPSSLHPCLVYSHPNPGHPAAPDKLQSSSWRHSTTNSAPLAYWGVTPELSPAVIHEQPPKPPHKELGSQPNRMPYRGDGRLDVVTLNEDDEDVGVRRIHEKVPPLVEGPAGLVERELGHRVSQLNRRRIIEIIVGGPHKVGDFDECPYCLFPLGRRSLQAARIYSHTEISRFPLVVQPIDYE